jgi:hypothetical protein
LPEWNRAIESVVERAPELAPGIEWVVKMHPSRGMTWQSRSRVEEIDMDAGRFSYRTWNADGNPSYTDWKWEVVPFDSAAQVTVNWDVYLKNIGSQVVGRTDSPTAASQGSSRVATGARQGHP